MTELRRPGSPVRQLLADANQLAAPRPLTSRSDAPDLSPIATIAQPPASRPSMLPGSATSPHDHPAAASSSSNAASASPTTRPRRAAATGALARFAQLEESSSPADALSSARARARRSVPSFSPPNLDAPTASCLSNAASGSAPQPPSGLDISGSAPQPPSALDTSGSAPQPPSALDTAAERQALEWLWHRVKPYLERRPLSGMKCSNAKELGPVLKYYGYGIGGWVALKTSMEGLYDSGCTLQSARAVLRPSFAAAELDAKDVVGGVYARFVQLSTDRIIDIIERHRQRRQESGRDCAAIDALLDDKVALLQKIKALLTIYIGVSSNVLADRIGTDEARARREDIHGLQVELYFIVPRDKREEIMIPLLSTGNWGPDGPLGPLPNVATSSAPSSSTAAAPPSASSLVSSAHLALPSNSHAQASSAISDDTAAIVSSSSSHAHAADQATESSTAAAPPVPAAINSIDKATHLCNAENLAVALIGKDRLTNLEDGGSHSREAPYLVSAAMHGVLRLDEIRPLRQVQLTWSLNASGGDAFETEKNHLVRTVFLLLGRDPRPGELDNMPSMKNLLPATATEVISKRKYQKARQKSRKPEIERQNAQTRKEAQAMGHQELNKLRDKPTVLVSCSLEFHLVLRDCLAGDDPPPRLLGASGWDEHLTRYSEQAQVALLRVGILYSPSRKLWLLRAINSTKAKALGHTATDMRAWAMAVSLRLSQILERGADPAKDEELMALLRLGTQLDYAYRLALKTSQVLGRSKKASKQDESDGEDDDEEAEEAGSDFEDGSGGGDEASIIDDEEAGADVTNLPSRLDARRAQIAEEFAAQERKESEKLARSKLRIEKRFGATSTPSTSTRPTTTRSTSTRSLSSRARASSAGSSSKRSASTAPTSAAHQSKRRRRNSPQAEPQQQRDAEEQLAALRDELAVTEERLECVQEVVEEKESRLWELEEVHQQCEEELAALGEQRDALAAEVWRLEGQRSEGKDAVVALRNRGGALEAQVGELEQKRQKRQDEVAAFGSQRDALAAEVGELEGQRRELEHEVAALGDQRVAATAEVGDLEGKKGRLGRDVAELEGKKEGLGSEVGELEATKERLGDEVGGLAVKRDRLGEEVGELVARKEQLASEIEALDRAVEVGEKAHAARLATMEEETLQASASKDGVESLLRDVEERLKAMRLTAEEEERKEEERQALRKRQREQDEAEDAEWEAARKRRRQEGQEADELAEKAREDDRKRADERARKNRADAATMADAHLLQQQRVLREQLDACIERHEKEIEEDRERTEAMIAEESRRRERRLEEIRNGN